MVTVCPLFADRVAVAMVTTVCPVGMALTMVVVFTGGAGVKVVLLLEVTLDWFSVESTKRRRRKLAGGEL